MGMLTKGDPSQQKVNDLWLRKHTVSCGIIESYYGTTGGKGTQLWGVLLHKWLKDWLSKALLLLIPIYSMIPPWIWVYRAVFQWSEGQWFDPHPLQPTCQSVLWQDIKLSLLSHWLSLLMIRWHLPGSLYQLCVNGWTLACRVRCFESTSKVLYKCRPFIFLKQWAAVSALTPVTTNHHNNNKDREQQTESNLKCYSAFLNSRHHFKSISILQTSHVSESLCPSHEERPQQCLTCFCVPFISCRTCLTSVSV